MTNRRTGKSKAPDSEAGGLRRTVLSMALALASCSQLMDLRPVEVDVQLREAAADLQAGVRVRVVGAGDAVATFFGTVRPLPVVGPRLEVTLGAARLDLMPVLDVVPLLVPMRRI